MKRWIHVAMASDDDDGDNDRAEAQCVWWYEGTSDLMVESAIRMLLQLPRDTQFLLRDNDGHLVPVTGSLPTSSMFRIVVMNGGATSSDDASGRTASGAPSRKRRRVVSQSAGDGDDEREAPRGSRGAPLSTASVAVARPRTIVDVVTKFVAVFTRPISNDDNVNFIPSSGEYSLYALYCRVFAGTSLFPKSTNAFYKITSAQGRIDRQRVMRYFQHTDAAGRIEYAEYKPEGKGPLLRRYTPVDSDEDLTLLVSAASFVDTYGLSAQDIVTQYISFLRGFRPIPKATYRAKSADKH
ncbi:hypothetical protein P43SY_003321 [Pythium insidiosum]|uniref:Uncharacterized protein n=1 Tax=Pythium insidiosum TaxID=114742 RepID=A0AAD5Q8I8_PYTIN|nr:hypothetical protein P43SY_003321 [Pythium insidiosum]